MKSFKNKNQGSALTTLLGGIIIVLAVLYFLVRLASSGYYSNVSDSTPSATETRIMPSGRLIIGDGTEPGQRTGKQVFDKICVQCHAADSSVAYAPKITHNSEWTARISQGFDKLVEHAVKGFTGAQGGVMPAKGGAQDLTDEEVARAVAYMVNQSGGNVNEPAVGGGAKSDSTNSNEAASGATAPVVAAGRGQEVFEQSCKVCHAADSAIPFAPKLTNQEDWAPRIKQGEDTLIKHAIEGYTNPKGGMMPAKGGNTSLSDDDVKAAVQYMVKQSGG